MLRGSFCWSWNQRRMKHKDPAWGAYRVFHCHQRQNQHRNG
jgi:hypothetical protein